MKTHPENWLSKSKEERNEEIVSRLLKAKENDKALEIAKERGTLVWVADDGPGYSKIEYDYCDTRLEAAKEYVANGDWGGERLSTSWVSVYTWPRYYVGSVYVDDMDDRYDVDTEIEPEEPECTSEDGHDWKCPVEIVGGIKENPGVLGHGGGVIINECCMNCGCKKTIDTWAQNPENGIQGLTAVSYEPKFYCEELDLYYEELRKYA